MRKIATAVVAFAAAAAMMTGCSSNNSAEEAKDASPSTHSAFPTTVKHSSGETKIEKQPERIIALDMAALDTVDALGAGDKVVGTVTKSVPSWLKDKYKDVASVGSLKEPDVEAIAKLKPDLLLIGARTASMYGDLSKNFTTVNADVDWEKPNYSKQVEDQVRQIGQAVGKTDQAEKLVQQIQKKVDDYKDTAKDKGTALVLMANEGELSVYGPQSRWAPIYDVFGFKEATTDYKPDEGHKSKKISFEAVKQLDPDYIFVVDRAKAIGKTEGSTPAEQLMDNELINSTKAAKNKHIVYLTPERWYIVMYGATNYPAELDEIADVIK